MIAIVLAFLRSHWKLAAGAGGLAAAFLAGWVAHRPPPAPAVALQHASASTQASSSATATHAEAGPVETMIDRVTYFGDDALSRVALLPGTPGAEKPRSACPPARIVEHIVEHRGPVVTVSRATEQQTRTETQKLHLKVTPDANRILFLGAQVAPEPRLVIAGAVRGPDLPILGPIWAQVQVAPLLSDPLRSQVTLLLGRQF